MSFGSEESYYEIDWDGYWVVDKGKVYLALKEGFSLDNIPSSIVVRNLYSSWFYTQDGNPRKIEKSEFLKKANKNNVVFFNRDEFDHEALNYPNYLIPKKANDITYHINKDTEMLQNSISDLTDIYHQHSDLIEALRTECDELRAIISKNPLSFKTYSTENVWHKETLKNKEDLYEKEIEAFKQENYDIRINRLKEELTNVKEDIAIESIMKDKQSNNGLSSININIKDRIKAAKATIATKEAISPSLSQSLDLGKSKSH